jgi:DNA ligase D-like protein (predicted ligase)
MAATLVAELPEGDAWLYEAKLDGYRALALKDADRVRLFSRRGNDLTRSYQAVEHAVRQLRAEAALIDGEIVAFDEHGYPSFQQLQNRTSRRTVIRYFAFDLLHLDGEDLTRAPLGERKRRLASLLRGSEVEFSESLPGTAAKVIEAVTRVGLEGVVAKRRDSRYEPGKRSHAWQKLKLGHRQEFVIGGYKPENTNFQSLVVGYYEGKTLKFAGRVRAGFTPALRHTVFERIKTLEVPSCLFADLPSGRTGRWGEGVTAQDMTILKWVKPKLVAEFSFVEWTDHGHLRHVRFLGLRDDKIPREVRRETPRSLADPRV